MVWNRYRSKKTGRFTKKGRGRNRETARSPKTGTIRRFYKKKRR